jgi:TPR repeat protein
MDRALIRTALIVVALAINVVAAKAGPFEEAEAAYKQGDYAAAQKLYQEAYKLFRPLAEHGDALAQFRIGDMYRVGGGVARDFHEAEKWYRKAAEQKQKEAQFYLGMFYFYGWGVPQDYVRAHMWFNIAASAATNLDDGKLPQMLRDGLAEKMTAAQIAEAQRLAREWLGRHPTAGPQ